MVYKEEISMKVSRENVFVTVNSDTYFTNTPLSKESFFFFFGYKMIRKLN